MKLNNKVRKGSKYITVHIFEGLGEIDVCGWPTKPELGKDNYHQVGQIIEL